MMCWSGMLGPARAHKHVPGGWSASTLWSSMLGMASGGHFQGSAASRIATSAESSQGYVADLLHKIATSDK